MKLQQGEYVSFGKVEAVLKTCPIVENVCLHAEGSKEYVLGIIVPDRGVMGEKFPDKKPEAAIKDPAVEKEILKMVTDYGMKNGLERFELPGKLLLTLDEWTPDTGLVTAAFKIRRKNIVDNYKATINKIY